jgi:hypothetical protein
MFSEQIFLPKNGLRVISLFEVVFRFGCRAQSADLTLFLVT